MKRFLICHVLVAFIAIPNAWAQEGEKKEEPTSQPSKPDAKKGDEKKDDGKKKDTKKKEGEKEDALPEAKEVVNDAKTKGTDATKPKKEEKKETKPEEKIADADPDSPFGSSPIGDIADKDFIPLEEIDEEELEQIIPAKVHPRVEWSGAFRIRGGVRNNFDLDTGGTSAVLPPIETYIPIGTPADSDKEARWNTNLNLRLDPTIHVLRDLRIHTEFNVLHNLVLGSLPSSGLGGDASPLMNQPGRDSQLSGREREFFGDAIRVNELFGEFDTLFATLAAGRMDDEWGLGMFTGSGDCDDCDYGNHVDRFRLTTNLFNFYGVATWDFPDEGPTSGSVFQSDGQPYDLAQIDEKDRWTFSVFRKAITREERELENKKLLDNDAVIPNGGLQYRFEKQKGAFTPRFDGESFDPTAPPSLVYLGSRTHVFDGWFSLDYRPDYKRHIQVSLEGLVAFGSVDNASGAAVGQPQDDDDEQLNCFDDDVRSAFPARCSEDVAGNSTKRDITQFGLALESDFRFDSPVSFGLNAGLASGGDTPTWGTGGNGDLDFFRFNPDYRIDLILFREVIGTVTNAFYANPHVEVKFFETASRHMELQFDGILSHAYNQDGTPSGVSGWLGLELDAAVSYIMHETFNATLEGGLLFPFNGLAAVSGRPRYVLFGSNPAEFSSNVDATIPWTVQAKLFWNF